MVRVVLPQHLRTLSGIKGEVELVLECPLTQRTVLDALEAAYPVLRGTIRNQETQRRRPFVRFFVGEEDWSNARQDEPLPPSVAAGTEPFIVLGAIAGG